MEPIEDVTAQYPGPFWAAYGALEGAGCRHAQIRADVSERIVAALLAAGTTQPAGFGSQLLAALAARPTTPDPIRIDNNAVRAVADQIGAQYPHASWRQAIEPAVYAAARVLTVG